MSDTRTLCAVCGIWQCLARHGGGFCHAVNGPSDTSCGACYANRPTVKPDLTVASEEPPACRQRAVSLHPRLRISYACVLTAGHNGECAPGGTCFEHGPYIGKPGTTPRCPKCPSPTITFVPAAVASPLPEEPPTDVDWHSVALELNDIIERATEITNPAGSIRRLLERRPTLAALAAKYPASSERSRLAGENAELKAKMEEAIVATADMIYRDCAETLAERNAENAELRKDAERLDWLQSCRDSLSVPQYEWVWEVTSTGRIDRWLPDDPNCPAPRDIRAALDVASARKSPFAGATGDRE